MDAGRLPLPRILYKWRGKAGGSKHWLWQVNSSDQGRVLGPVYSASLCASVSSRGKMETMIIRTTYVVIGEIK